MSMKDGSDSCAPCLPSGHSLPTRSERRIPTIGVLQRRLHFALRRTPVELPDATESDSRKGDLRFSITLAGARSCGWIQWWRSFRLLGRLLALAELPRGLCPSPENNKGACHTEAVKAGETVLFKTAGQRLATVWRTSATLNEPWWECVTWEDQLHVFSRTSVDCTLKLKK